MEKNEIIQIIKNEKQVEKKELEQIQKLIEQYPYCELFPVIYINAQKKLAEDYIPSLIKYSININNRAKFIENLFNFPVMLNEDFEKIANMQQQQEKEINVQPLEKQNQTKQGKKYDSKFDEEIYRRQSMHHKSVLLDIIKDKVDSFSLFSKNLQKAGMTEDEFCKIVEENAINNHTVASKQQNDINNSETATEKIDSNSTEQKTAKNKIESKDKTNGEEKKEIIKPKEENNNIILEKEVKQKLEENKEETNKINEKEITEKTKGILSKIEELRTKKLLSKENKETNKEENKIPVKEIDNKIGENQTANKQEISQIKIQQNLSETEVKKLEITKEQNISINDDKTQAIDNKIEELKEQDEKKTKSAAEKLIEKLRIKKQSKIQAQQVAKEEEILDMDLINKLEIEQTEKKHKSTLDNSEIVQNEVIEIDFEMISKQIEQNNKQSEKAKNQEIKNEIEQTKEQTNTKQAAIEIKDNKEIPQKEQFNIKEENEKIEIETKKEIKEQIDNKEQNQLEQKNNKEHIETEVKQESKKTAADKILERLSNRKKEPQNIIEEFMEKQPSIDRKKEPTTQEDLSEKSVKEMEIVTERLAEIYVLQGLKDKAIEVYEKLILKYPEKSVYFAQKIEDLKK